MQAKIHGIKIHFVSTGAPTATPVVLVHGFPFSHAMWEPQLGPLGRQHWTIAYDLRGHGSSAIGDGQYTIEGHVDDLIGLLDHLEIDRSVIVGLSMGGYVTLRALERQPERFRAVVLCDTRSEADDDEGRLKRAGAIADVKREGAAAFAESFVSKVFTAETLKRALPVVETIRGIIASTDPLSLAGNLLAMAARTDTTASLSSVEVPALILVGEHDSITPPTLSRAMAARIPDAELHVVPAAGHLSNLENPEFFNAKLLDFLGRRLRS